MISLRPYYRLLFFSICLYSTHVGLSQKSSLLEVINELEKSRRYSFSYDPELIEGFFVSFEGKSNVSNVSLDDLTEKLPFDFEVIQDEFVLVKTRPVTLDLGMKDFDTGEKIPGVYVKKNGDYLEVISDGDGNLRFTIEWKKTDSLSFEFIGYETRHISVRDRLQSEEKVIELSTSTTVLDGIIVRSYLGEGISAHQKDHTLNIKNDDLGILPGDADKDLLVSLKTLPGIHTVTGRAGEIRVRGGTPDQTLVLFDNIPIYHNGYYFGAISPFNTEVVDEVKVYRSGYSPNLGGRVGGAIEITSEKEVPKELHGGLSTNSYFFSGYGKAPLINDKLGISIAARTSHPFDYTSPKEKEFQQMVLAASNISILTESPDGSLDEATYDFWDLNGSVVFTPNDNHNLRLNFLTINNTNVITTSNVTRGSTSSQENLLDNSGVNLSWNGKWGKWRSNAFITNSQYNYQLDVFSKDTINALLTNTQQVANKINNTRIGTSLTRKMGSKGAEMNFGYEYSRIVNRFNDSMMSVNRSPVPDRPMPGNPPMPNNPMMPGQMNPDGLKQPGNIQSVYGSFFIPDWNKMMVNLGLRLNYFDSRSFFRPEPRLFLNYNLSDQFTIKSSFGLYSQYLERKLFFDFTDIVIEKLVWGLSDQPNSKVMTSWQALFGGAYQSSDWLLDVDFYYKEVEGLSTNGPFIEVAPGITGPSLLLGDLFTHGMDILMKYNVGNFNIWSNYTYGRVSMLFEDLKTDRFPANYDQTHNFNISTSFQRRNLKASVGWFLSSGLPNYLEDTFFPFTGPTTVPLDAPSPTGNLERFKGIHQLDASVAYEIIPKSGMQKITLGISVLNLYARENLLETVNVRIRSPRDQLITREANRYTIGFAPDFMLKIEF